MSGKKDKVADKDRFSIITPDLTHCCVCGTSDRICLHEVFFGTSNRKKSKEDGMVIPLCFEHHQGTFGVHNNKQLDDKFKQQAEKVWLVYYTDEEDTYEEKVSKFIKRFGRNYLDE